MKRRDLLKRSMLLGAAGLSVPLPRLYAAPFEGYSGRLLVTLQCDGGWDVSSFCDPKTNQPGEKEITAWSNSNDVQTAGNINYAPFAKNQSFFDNHYQDMLVINGVDMQTNSHTTGVLHSWSGRNSQGYPAITALFAANNAPEQPLSYLNFGGYSETANLIRFSRLNGGAGLDFLLEPSYLSCLSPCRRQLSTEVNLANIREFRNNKIQEMMSDATLMNRQKVNLQAYSLALSGQDNLKKFLDYAPDNSELEGGVTLANNRFSSLRDQVRYAAAAFQSGLTSAVDLWESGFDSHGDNDSQQTSMLSHVTDAIQLFWQQAEERGVADRVTMVIGSDFSRTPHYNGTNGKDHWPIGSFIVMEKNASWTNRVVGQTDEGQNAFKINPNTLERDNSGGTIIYPKHVHKALRRHLGIENSVVEENLAFANTEDFAFFD